MDEGRKHRVPDSQRWSPARWLRTPSPSHSGAPPNVAPPHLHTPQNQLAQAARAWQRPQNALPSAESARTPRRVRGSHKLCPSPLRSPHTTPLFVSASGTCTTHLCSSFPKPSLLERRGRGSAPLYVSPRGESGSGAAARAWLGHDSLDSFLDSSPDERLFTAYSTSTLRVVAANLGEVAVVPPRAPDASVPRIPGFRSLALVVKLMRRCWVREAQKRLAEGDQIRSPRVRCPPLGAAHDVVHEALVSVACQQAALRVILCGGGG